MNTMRKNLALFLVALLSLTLAFAAVSCGQKTEETSTTGTETTTPPADQGMESMPMDTSMADTSMSH